jgi:radical SAM protein with 4Fe4S-binding SPASM domain
LDGKKEERVQLRNEQVLSPALDIAITSRCNLNCKHCYWGETKELFGDLPLSLLSRTITQARNLGFRSLILTGGEPTLHRDFVKILRLSAKEGLRIELVTNGTLLERFVETLAQANVHRIIVSLDGFKKEYEAIRGYSWERVVRNIRLLVEKDFRVRINALASKALAKKHREFIEFCTMELGVEEVVFLPPALSGSCIFHPEIVPEPKDLRRIALYCGSSKEQPCSPFYEQLAVGFNGFVYPCEFFREIDWYRLGNLFNRTLTEIYRWARARNIFPTFPRPKECIRCEYFEKCRGGCPGRALAVVNEVGPDPAACALLREGTLLQLLPRPRNPLYTSLAGEYSKAYKRKAERELYPLVENICLRYRPRSLLDIGCGDGSFLARMERHGIEGVGIDTSKELLDIARRKCGCPLHNTSLEDFEAEERFDVAVALYSFFLHFGDEREVQKALLKIRNLSRVFIFDSPLLGNLPPHNGRFRFGGVRATMYFYQDGKYGYDFRVYRKGKKEYWSATCSPLINFSALLSELGARLEEVRRVGKREIYIVRW